MNLVALSQIHENNRSPPIAPAIKGLRYSMEWVVTISLRLFLICTIGGFVWIFPIRKKMVRFTRSIVRE